MSFFSNEILLLIGLNLGEMSSCLAKKGSYKVFCLLDQSDLAVIKELLDKIEC